MNADMISAGIGGVLLTAFGLAAFGFPSPSFWAALGVSLAGGAVIAGLARAAAPHLTRKWPPRRKPEA